MDDSHHDEVILKALEHLDAAMALLRAIVGSKGGRPLVPVDEDFLNADLQSIDFGYYTSRVHHLARYATYYDHAKGKRVPKDLITVRDLVSLTELDCSRMDNVGRKTVDRIKVVLASHGLRLGMFPPTDDHAKEQTHA